MRILTLIIAFFLVASAGFSQSQPFFGRMSKPAAPHSGVTLIHPRALAITASGDSIFTGFRPTATAAYGYSKDGGNSILAFAGIAYEHDTYKSATEHWNTDWAISLQIGTGASNGSVSLANATTIGLFGSFWNKLLTVGIGYNFSNKNAVALVGPGVAFH